MSEEPDRYRAQLLNAVRLASEAPADTGQLATLLYERWYAPPSGASPGRLDPAEVSAHYQAADAASGRFEPGWIVLHPKVAWARIGPPASPWQVPAARGAETRWVDPVDLYADDGVGLRPAAGASITVSSRLDSVELLPGWWTSMSRAWSSGSPPLVRLYWSVPPEHACRLVDGLTGSLDPGAPYALKCPLDLDRCRRPDAVVLYLPSSAWKTMCPGLTAGYRRVQAWLRPLVPALTLRLARGLALAEDPGVDSFGTNRCRMLAGGLADARRAGITDAGVLLDAAVGTLARHGVDPDSPWRNPGSATTYLWDHHEPA